MFYLDLFKSLHERKVRYLHVPIRVAALDDMISLKQNTGRRQDEDDIAHLLRIKGHRP